uniref:HTH CENPB-type domain-containing protein n=1 Tax=Caenorhabditis tropicalis TaxID=1561998 RepID=A0A1I7SZ93_9PELO
MDLNDEKILKITEKAIYNAEIADLSNFVREQCASEDCPVSVADLARDYITHSHSFKSLHVWMDRFV